MSQPEPGSHPFFDDQAATSWYPDLASALVEAKSANKRVFVHVGRLACGGSRALIEKVLPKEEISEFLREHFVCLALDVDELPEEFAALVEKLPKKEPTPLCVYLSGEGDVVHSTVGGRPAAVFLRDMTEALPR